MSTKYDAITAGFSDRIPAYALYIEPEALTPQDLLEVFLWEMRPDW